MEIKKVSFDFDGTLSREDVQEYAQILIKKDDIEVWICTSRFIDEFSTNQNNDLYEVSDKIGIDRSKIIFTSRADKYEYFIDKDFVWHLDDDWIETDLINEHTDTIGVRVFGNEKWKNECENALFSDKF